MNKISNRKDDHLALVIKHEAVSGVDAGFSDYRFEHNALPEIDLSEIDTSLKFLGRNVSFPIIVSAITGGGKKSEEINRGLAELAGEFNVGFSVGSQRIAVEDKSFEKSFKVRNYAPNILLLANLGAVQLNYGFSIDECKRAVDMIGADALTLHLNPLQEAFQLEGNTNFSGLLHKIEKICRSLNVPVIVKETGYGISSSVAKKLHNAGVQVVDIAGAGSISLAEIESRRSNDIVIHNASKTFLDWGNPTTECIKSISENVKKIKIVASGGVKTGLDIAKAIRLGAEICGNATQFLRKIIKSRSECKIFMDSLIIELKVSMFCIGAKNIKELKSAKLIKIK